MDRNLISFAKVTIIKYYLSEIVQKSIVEIIN